MDMNLHKRLGISIPIIQAPMAGVQGSALAIAVCNAGGLGSLPAAMLGADALREELTVAARRHQPAVQRELLLPRSRRVPIAAREAAWRGRLAPYYAELGIDPAASRRAGRARRSAPRSADLLERVRAAGRRASISACRRRRSWRRVPRVGRQGPLLGDHRRRGALARGARRRRDHRAGRRGRRPSRHVSSPTT